jgi:hypothetical protein
LRSIFDSEEDVTTVEDLVILQDLDEADEDWRFVKRQRYPAKTFTNGDTTLTIILANKQPLETQLGFDLIYVNRRLSRSSSCNTRCSPASMASKATGQINNSTKRSHAWMRPPRSSQRPLMTTVAMDNDSALTPSSSSSAASSYRTMRKGTCRASMFRSVIGSGW